MSGPLVRSSYRAGRLYAQAIEQRAATRAAAGFRLSGAASGRPGSFCPGRWNRMLRSMARMSRKSGPPNRPQWTPLTDWPTPGG